MNRGRVITTWVGDGLSTETAFRPDLPVGVYQPGGNYGNPQTTACVSHFRCSRALHDQMEADSTKWVLWSEEDDGRPIIGRSDPAPQAEWGQFNAYLTNLGLTEQERQAIAGRDRTEFTREQIAENWQAFVDGST